MVSKKSNNDQGAAMNGKGKTPEAGFDLAVADGTAEMEAHVACRVGGQLRDFRVLVRAEGLILQGCAHTYYAKQLAQHAIMAATDLPIQANEIEVLRAD